MPTLPEIAVTAAMKLCELSTDDVALALVDQIEIGLIACRENGSLLFVNRYAKTKLEGCLGPSVVWDIFRQYTSVQNRLRSAVHAAARHLRGELLTVTEGTRELSIVIMPLRVAQSNEPIVMLMFGRGGLCSPLGFEMLAMSHRLTVTEKRVLKALVSNLSPREIATSHGVSLPTIRTQVQSIRDKLGARSVDALLLRIASVPPVACLPATI